MSVTRKQIIAEALTWLDTPWRHQAMIKGTEGGVDCAMFLVGVAKNLGMLDEDTINSIPNYPKDWHFHNTESMMIPIIESLGAEKIYMSQSRPGDILLFKVGRCESHMGIKLAEDMFIHAYTSASTKKVLVMRMDDAWKKRLTHAYKFPGV